jgi:mRNA-degrading endonuclease toxin of MazEF toxin-antitoxin module
LTATNPTPHRGEVWIAELGDPPRRHWILVVSLNARNTSDRVDSVLIVPFGSAGIEGPTALKLEPGETGLPTTSYLKGHYITVLKKARLKERHPRALSQKRMGEVTAMIRRAFDPDAPWEPGSEKSHR